MDEEVGVKVPITRLRRRLSVEQSEEVKSSPAANTPTKKRGGRRTAKPELDLIDENVPDNNNTSKRTTRKAAVRELEEADEKPLTPSRRSARIRSNTSLVSENTQTFDSPRAKRVARRASQVGSDNEATLTPVRQTRRTRKDSTSNVENAEPLQVKPMTGIIVEEEAESSKKNQKSPIKSIEQNNSPSGSRKSPRLSLKKNENKTESKNNTEIIDRISLEDHNSSNKENETETLAMFKENASLSDIPNVEKNYLSESSSELLRKLKTEPDKKTSTLNKSTSAITDNLEFKSKRHRTKSWTTLSTPVLNDNVICFSDSESIKKKRKSTLDNSNNTHLEISLKTQKNNSSLKKIKKTSQNDSSNISQLDLLNTSNQTGKDEILAHSESSTDAEAVTRLFEKEPSTILKTTIFIEETDSNSEKNQKHDDDQCVPEVEPHYKEESKNDIQVNLNCSKDNQDKIMCDNKNNSCEPMDIDETIPDNVSLSRPETSANKESSKDQVMESSINHGNKKRKSSLTTCASQVLEKSCNENKSTLVLSQLKDISNDNNVLQSSQVFTEKKSKSDNALDTTQDDNGLDGKNSLSAYSTSTPLHQKGLMKIAMQMNTSDMTSNNTSKIEKSNSKVIKKKSSNITNSSSEQSESEEESEQEESKLIDDEAEEASDDYESGDSKDEEQEQYEKENEIVQKGETLTSEDELSNDTDYEKDSFVVSSDEEDDDLLDGSGDDLSMSDNELKMTRESKKKYDERKLKEQKKASREMFESRHKLNATKESIKSESLNKKKKRAVIDSSFSENDDTQIKAKKNNKMRLDSSHETSASKSLDDTQVKAKKNKSRLDSSHETSANKSLNNSCNAQTEANNLSKSIDNKSATNEVEMTIFDENSNNEADPLAIGIKQEPVTPQISSTNVSIQFVDSENSAEKEGGKNKLHKNFTHIDDPLEGSNASSSSDSSDNIHIQNYDSVLTELNNSVKNKKNKTANISLNYDKKTKQKATPIVDELNLTQVKTKIQKKVRNKDEGDSSKIDKKTSNEKSFSKNKSNIEDNDNDSSDSIDIHLLFSEDSNGSENQQNNRNNDVETFIPLKKNPGKTNILENSATKYTTESKKKNELRKTDDKTVMEDQNDDDGSSSDDGISDKTFKDTKRETKSNEEIDKTVSSMNNKSITKTPRSEKKKRDKKISETLAINEQDAPAEAPYKSLKETGKEKNNEKNNKSVSSMHNNSVAKTPNNKNKKKKNSESLTQEEKDGDSDSDPPTEISNKSFSEDKIDKMDTREEIVLSMHTTSTVETPKSEKKKKKISESSTSGITDKTLNESVTNTPASIKKKKNKLSDSQSAEQMHAGDEVVNKSLTKTPLSEKKKKKRLSESNNLNISTNESPVVQENENIETDKSMNHSVTKTPKSEKKKKKRLSEIQSAEQISNEVTTENDDHNMSRIQVSDLAEELSSDSMANKSVTKIPKSDKKKAKVLQNSVTTVNIVQSDMEHTYKEKNKIQESNNEVNENTIKEKIEIMSSKKRKRKSSHNQTDEEQDNGAQSTPVTSHEPNISEVQNKRRKISHNTENADQGQNINKDILVVQKEQRRKNSKSKDFPHNQVNFEKGATETDNNMTLKKETKKRKQREDDVVDKSAKVQKTNSLDKVNVPRLPTSILNKLEENPKHKNLTVTKSKVISTSNFIVEEAKITKNKPSNYLEESVYLNEDDLLESKKQQRIKNPKVLPFLPTVSTSNSGYTTNFKVNVIPKEFKFVARSSNVSNFKNDFLENKKIKRIGTYELYKRNRNVKLSKF